MGCTPAHAGVPSLPPTVPFRMAVHPRTRGGAAASVGLFLRVRGDLGVEVVSIDSIGLFLRVRGDLFDACQFVRAVRTHAASGDTLIAYRGGFAVMYLVSAGDAAESAWAGAVAGRRGVALLFA